jgi:hypothetical protein
VKLARLVAMVVLVLGGAFLPGTADAVEIVDTSQPLVFSCVLHQSSPDAPWVGARTAVREVAPAHR